MHEKTVLPKSTDVYWKTHKKTDIKVGTVSALIVVLVPRMWAHIQRGLMFNTLGLLRRNRSRCTAS